MLGSGSFFLQMVPEITVSQTVCFSEKRFLEHILNASTPKSGKRCSIILSPLPFSGLRTEKQNFRKNIFHRHETGFSSGCFPKIVRIIVPRGPKIWYFSSGNVQKTPKTKPLNLKQATHNQQDKGISSLSESCNPVSRCIYPQKQESGEYQKAKCQIVHTKKTDPYGPVLFHIVNCGLSEPFHIAEVFSVWQSLVLRIHTASSLEASGIVQSISSGESIQVAFLLHYFEWSY